MSCVMIGLKTYALVTAFFSVYSTIFVTPSHDVAGVRMSYRTGDARHHVVLVHDKAYLPCFGHSMNATSTIHSYHTPKASEYLIYDPSPSLMPKHMEELIRSNQEASPSALVKNVSPHRRSTSPARSAGEVRRHATGSIAAAKVKLARQNLRVVLRKANKKWKRAAARLASARKKNRTSPSPATEKKLAKEVKRFRAVVRRSKRAMRRAKAGLLQAVAELRIAKASKPVKAAPKAAVKAAPKNVKAAPKAAPKHAAKHVKAAPKAAVKAAPKHAAKHVVKHVVKAAPKHVKAAPKHVKAAPKHVKAAPKHVKAAAKHVVKSLVKAAPKHVVKAAPKHAVKAAVKAAPKAAPKHVVKAAVTETKAAPKAAVKTVTSAIHHVVKTETVPKPALRAPATSPRAPVPRVIPKVFVKVHEDRPSRPAEKVDPNLKTPPPGTPAPDRIDLNRLRTPAPTSGVSPSAPERKESPDTHEKHEKDDHETHEKHEKDDHEKHEKHDHETHEKDDHEKHEKDDHEKHEKHEKEDDDDDDDDDEDHRRHRRRLRRRLLRKHVPRHHWWIFG